MASLARQYPQENLISIGKAQFRKIREALNQNRLLAFSKGAWSGGDNTGWRMKSAAGDAGLYLLVEHYEEKESGGLTVVYKVDTTMYDAFLQQR